MQFIAIASSPAAPYGQSGLTSAENAHLICWTQQSPQSRRTVQELLKACGEGKPRTPNPTLRTRGAGWRPPATNAGPAPSPAPPPPSRRVHALREARARRAGAGPAPSPPRPPPAAASARASQPLFHSLCSAPLSWSTPAGGAALKLSRPFREREPILLAAAALAGGGGSELGGSQSRAALLVPGAEWAVV